MKTQNKNVEVKYSIVNVRQISFSANESLLVQPPEVILSTINVKTAFSEENNLFNLTLKAWYHYKDQNDELAVTEVENFFLVQNLSNYLNADREIEFPWQLWVSIVGLAISHTRALFAQRLAGTAFQNNILGIMDPYATAKHFFPKPFENLEKKSSPKKTNKLH